MPTGLGRCGFYVMSARMKDRGVSGSLWASKTLHGVFSIAQRNNFKCEAVQSNPLVSFLPENERLAMLNEHDLIVLRILFGEFEESAVVEDVAVLIDLDK